MTKSHHPRLRAAIDLIDAWVDAEQSYRDIPGISLALVHDQDVVFDRGYGYANPQAEVPMSSATLFSICSISKLFTAIAIMQLRDAGKLQLHDPIAKHLDWFDIPGTQPDDGPLTIESVLTHSSGLPRESDFPYWSGPDYAFPDRDAVIERLKSQHTLYPASTFFQYSNLGLTLAGEIVAAVSGAPYADYVTEHILDPLGLPDTRPAFPTELHGSALALGHTARDRTGRREIVPPFDTKAITPAAGFTSSALDLARFASWQFRVLDGQTEVLAPSTLREMHRIHWVDPNWETTWGIGFQVERQGQATVVGHGGACPGYLTDITIDPQHKIAAIAMFNACGHSPGAVTRHALRLYREALTEARTAPDADSRDHDSPDGTTDFCGSYDMQPWTGEMCVFPWQDDLGVVVLPADNPTEALFKLRHANGDTFRLLREGDGTPEPTLGEEVTFTRASDGKVRSMTRHSQRMLRIARQ